MIDTINPKFIHAEITSIGDTFIIVALGHDYDSVTVAPTCLEKGYTTYTCSVCNDTYTDDEVDALGHDEVAHDAKAPTCTEAGYNAYVTCSRCDYTTFEAVSALGHDEVAHDAKAPTCTEAGNKAYNTCSRCDYTTFEAVDALGHDKVEHAAQAPTCTEYGWNTYLTCTRCDYTTYEKLASLGHKFSDGVCTECGAAEKNNYYINLVNSWKDMDGFVITIKDLSFEIKTTDGSFEPSIAQIGKITQLDIAELNLYIEDADILGAAHGTVSLFDGPIKGANAIADFKAVINDGYIYVVISYGEEGSELTQSMKMSVDAIIEQILDEGVDLDEEEIDAIEFCVDNLLPMIETLVDLNEDNVNATLEKAFGMIFTIEEQADGSYVATLDYDKLSLLNENLATKSVAEVIDIYFDEGTFDKLVSFMLEVLDLKVSEVPGYVDDMGLNSDELISKINKFLVDFVGAPTDFDLNDFFNDEDYADMTLGMLAFETEDDSYVDDFNDAEA